MDSAFVRKLFAPDETARRRLALLATSAVLYRYWMTDPKPLRETGRYFRREQVAVYTDEAFDP